MILNRTLGLTVTLAGWILLVAGGLLLFVAVYYRPTLEFGPAGGPDSTLPSRAGELVTVLVAGALATIGILFLRLSRHRRPVRHAR
jgi:hypothetical protein